MAHFAKIGVGNVVEKVEVVSNNIATSEQAGVEFLQNLYKDRAVWKQTSYNTIGGVHLLGGTPFRKNYAAVGGTYDSIRDAFIGRRPFASWILNETTCLWEAPISIPDDDKNYVWNEATQQWDLDE
tara:strand:+ start:32 stop:409 length:378 start_codon:yes stop_codon:yes gene_type:complete